MVTKEEQKKVKMNLQVLEMQARARLLEKFGDRKSENRVRELKHKAKKLSNFL